MLSIYIFLVVLYLWGIETCTNILVPFLRYCCTVPMRNWNKFSFMSLLLLLKCCTVPMRNWNLIWLLYSFRLQFLVVLYLWGIEHRFVWWEIIIQKEIHICMLSSLMMLEQSGLVRLWRHAVSIWFMCFCRYIQTHYCW